MNTPPQTTEFSAHLSWAGMRRYLQETLPVEKSRRVERHLRHCPRCSSAIIDYIQAEEPAHYKQYTKKLKGILKAGQTEKKSVLSSFQMKAIRTTTAVVALLIFSFFALRTVINKQADYSLPSESLAATEQQEVVSTHRSLTKKTAKAAPKTVTVIKEFSKTKKTVKASKKAAPKPSDDVSVTEAPTVITKARTAPAPKKAAAATSMRPEQAQHESKPQTNTSTESTAPLATEKAAPARQEEVAEAPVNEATSRKPLPALPKIKTTESAAAVAPLDSSTPAEMPVPSNEILER